MLSKMAGFPSSCAWIVVLCVDASSLRYSLTLLASQVIMNSAIINMGMHMSFQQTEMISGYTPSSGIGRPYGSSIFTFFSQELP